VPTQHGGVPVMPCLHVLRAGLSTQGTGRGSFYRAVPPVGHGHIHQAVPAHGPSGEKNLKFFEIFTSVHHFHNHKSFSQVFIIFTITSHFHNHKCSSFSDHRNKTQNKHTIEDN
jgi:hypothetical protein